MAKNKQSKGFNLTGKYDKTDNTLGYIDKDSALLFSLQEKLNEYHGLEISITVTTQSEVEPLRD